MGFRMGNFIRTKHRGVYTVGCSVSEVGGDAPYGFEPVERKKRGEGILTSVRKQAGFMPYDPETKGM